MDLPADVWVVVLNSAQTSRCAASIRAKGPLKEGTQGPSICPERATGGFRNGRQSFFGFAQPLPLDVWVELLNAAETSR